MYIISLFMLFTNCFQYKQLLTGSIDFPHICCHFLVSVTARKLLPIQLHFLYGCNIRCSHVPDRITVFSIFYFLVFIFSQIIVPHLVVKKFGSQGLLYLFYLDFFVYCYKTSLDNCTETIKKGT